LKRIRISTILGIPFRIKTKILKETNYLNILDSSISIQSELLNEQGKKLPNTNFENGLIIEDLERMSTNYRDNIKKNNIPLANFVSSIGIEDMTQYNTAVSVTSSTLKQKDNNQKNKNYLMIDYLKNVKY